MFGNVSCYTGMHKLKEDKIAIPWRMMLIFPGCSMNILRSSRFSDNFLKFSWISCDSYQYSVSIWTLEANVFGNNFHRNKRIQGKQVSCHGNAHLVLPIITIWEWLDCGFLWGQMIIFENYWHVCGVSFLATVIKWIFEQK